MTRTTSAAGRAALMAREGCRLEAYRDSVGVPTIGVGHTGRASPPAVAMGMTITQAEADAIFATDLAPFEAAVNGAVIRPMKQNQFDACVSLAFNIGVPGFVGSTVVHKLNAGDISGAADAFLMWEKPAVLAKRRIGERAQFLTADPPPTSISNISEVVGKIDMPPGAAPSPGYVPSPNPQHGTPAAAAPQHWWQRILASLSNRKA